MPIFAPSLVCDAEEGPAGRVGLWREVQRCPREGRAGRQGDLAVPVSVSVLLFFLSAVFSVRSTADCQSCRSGFGLSQSVAAGSQTRLQPAQPQGSTACQTWKLLEMQVVPAGQDDKRINKRSLVNGGQGRGCKDPETDEQNARTVTGQMGPRCGAKAGPAGLVSKQFGACSGGWIALSPGSM